MSLQAQILRGVMRWQAGGRVQFTTRPDLARTSREACGVGPTQHLSIAGDLGMLLWRVEAPSDRQSDGRKCLVSVVEVKERLCTRAV